MDAAPGPLSQGEQPEDALWVVLKWDGLAPLALYPSAQQTSGIGLGRLFGAQARAGQWLSCASVEHGHE